jgi:DNA-directed RNA polymerase specialized sigma24 family protein
VDKLKEEQRLIKWSDLTGAADSQAAKAPEDPVAPGISPIDAVIRKETVREFKRVVDLVGRRLRRLNTKYCEIFKLRLECTHPNAEIAAQLDCSEATVKRGWAYAVKLLKALHDGSVVDDLED